MTVNTLISNGRRHPDTEHSHGRDLLELIADELDAMCEDDDRVEVQVTLYCEPAASDPGRRVWRLVLVTTAPGCSATPPMTGEY
jgi:hypothetical protein